MGVLSSGLLRYHSTLYAAGAVLLLVLAGIAATGGTWSLPFLRSSPDISRTDSAGVYALGVFSGAASACCAPVLAGMLTLSAVSPSLVAVAGLGLAYVFGMVFPLVAMTLVWDRVQPEGFNPGGRSVTWRIGSRRFTTTVAGLVTAAMFTVMGAILAVVAATGSSLASPLQTRIGGGIEDALTPALDQMAWIPDPVVGLILIAVAVGAVVLSVRRPRQTSEPLEKGAAMTKKTSRTHRRSARARATPWRWVGFGAPIFFLAVLVALSVIDEPARDEPGTAPDFRLTATSGQEISLTETLTKGDTLLYFSMGVGCDGCFAQIPEIEDDLARWRVTLLPIMVDPASSVAAEAARFGIETPILLDPGAEVARAYGMVGIYGHADRPSHSFALVRRDGTIGWVRHYAEMFVPADALLGELDQVVGA